MKKLLLSLTIITFLTGCTASDSILIATVPIGGAVGGAVGTVVGTGVGAVAAPVLAVNAMVEKSNIPTFLIPVAAIPVVAIYIPAGVVVGAIKGLTLGVVTGVIGVFSPPRLVDELESLSVSNFMNF